MRRHLLTMAAAALVAVATPLGPAIAQPPPPTPPGGLIAVVATSELVDVRGWAPGDVHAWLSEVTNLTEEDRPVGVHVEAAGRSALTTSVEHGLRVAVEACSAPWRVPTTLAAATAACPGEQVTLSVATAVAAFGGAAVAWRLPPGATRYVRAVVALPVEAGNELEGLTDQLAIRFVATDDPAAPPPLPRTGAAVEALAALGAGLAGLGGLIAVAARRRRRLAPRGPHRVATPSRRWLAAGICGAVAVGAGSAWAALSDREATVQSAGAGRLDIALAGPGSSGAVALDVTGLGPGTTVERAVTLRHTGTVALYGAGPHDPAATGLQLRTASSQALATDTSGGVQLEVAVCPQPWQAPSGSSSAWSCAGASSVLVADRPLVGAMDLPATLAAYRPGGASHLLIRLRLPVTAPPAHQGSEATIGLRFDALQREGTTR